MPAIARGSRARSGRRQQAEEGIEEGDPTQRSRGEEVEDAEEEHQPSRASRKNSKTSKASKANGSATTKKTNRHAEEDGLGSGQNLDGQW